MILQRMDLPADVAQGMVEFVHNQASLLQGTGAPLPLLQLLRGMNDETWMVIEGSETVTETVKGAHSGPYLHLFVCPGHHGSEGGLAFVGIPNAPPVFLWWMAFRRLWQGCRH